MKRNLFFFFLLVTLLIFTYYFEERGGLQKKEIQENEARVLDFQSMGKLKEFRTKNLTLKSENGELYSTQTRYQTDTGKISKLFDIFSNIKIKRVLTSDERLKLSEKDFFPDQERNLTFVLENASLYLLLGIKNTVDDTFYLKIRRSDQSADVWVLAYDASLVEGIYTEDEDRLAGSKYQRLINILKLKEDYFYDKHLLRVTSPVQKVRIENTRNRPFEVDFVLEKTSPDILKGIQFYKEGSRAFLEEMYKLEAKRITFQAPLEKLADPLATMTFFFADNEKLVLKLFKKFGKESGYFAINSTEKTLFEMDAKVAPLFYSHIQSFWDKSLAHCLSEKFTVEISGKKVEITQKDRLEVTRRLFEFLKTQADQVFDFTPEELPSSPFKVHFANTTLVFTKNAQELSLFDLNNSKKYVYLAASDSLSFELSDYLK